MLAEKQCPACGQTKKVTEFGKDKNSEDGRYTYCLPCDREKQRESYQRKKERQALEEKGTLV
jgi:hypothetical protein